MARAMSSKRVAVALPTSWPCQKAKALTSLKEEGKSRHKLARPFQLCDRLGCRTGPRGYEENRRRRTDR